MSVLHRTLAAGVFHCGAKASEGARGTPKPDKVTCEQCCRRVLARQYKDATSLHLLTQVRAELVERIKRLPS